MMAALPTPTPLATPTPRAMAIATGLIRSGRASGPETFRQYIRLADASRERHYVAFNGNRLFRGDTLEQASELQHGFIEAMARKGNG
jgi:hypothetical protein